MLGDQDHAPALAFDDGRTHTLHVIQNLEIGGAENLVYQFVKNMDPSRFRSSVCCLGRRGPLGERLAHEGFAVHALGAAPGFRMQTVRSIREIVLGERVGVIHAHTYTPFFFSAFAKPVLRDVKLVYTEHGRLFPDRDILKRQVINPLLFRRADHIVSISESTKRSMAFHDNIPLDRIRTIWNGVPQRDDDAVESKQEIRASLGLEDDAPVVGMAARIVELKNFPMALRAFRRVLELVPRARLVIAGDGPQLPELKSLASSLGIDSRVSFLGMRDDLNRLYDAFDLFALSSKTEGISITLLEAMARGLPSVVTRVGGNPEVVLDGRTGLLVGSDDDQAMAEAIAALLVSPDERARMGENAAGRVKSHFSFDGMLNRYAALYNS